jgi:hypothetical protein
MHQIARMKETTVNRIYPPSDRAWELLNMTKRNRESPAKRTRQLGNTTTPTK